MVSRPGDSKGSRATTWPERGGVRAGSPLQVALDRRARVAATLRAWMAAEAGPGRLIPWIPIAFGAGIALYFAAGHEPSLWAPLALTVVLADIAFMLRAHPAFASTVLIAALAAGFSTATFRTLRVGHNVLARPVTAATIRGFVETRDIRDRTDRFVLRIVDLESARSVPDLERVRLAVRKGTAPDVGSYVELKARLTPPLTPLRPGSYDFARDMFFQGIGASGFVLGSIKTLEPAKAGGWALSYAATMQDLRDAIDARIRGSLSGDDRAIATALLTGRRDAISTPVNDAMFISGLGHVLSISGYHMAVVAGVVFFAIRGLLALIPGLTAAYPIKKWAAAAALVAAAFYLLLSGAEVATQRSFLMTAVVLSAIMVDRRAVTLRTLAIAAFLVLAIAPEALVHPSFQMSFAATLGLVVLVERGMPRLFSAPDNSGVARAALWGGREAVTLALASLVAGLATTPYAAFHFHRITPYGLLANLAAMPVVSGIVMPAGLLGLLATPFGLDGIFWSIMGVGIDWMVAVAEWVARLPGAVGRIASFGTGPLLLATLGIVLIGLLRTPLRWAGALLLGLAAVAAVIGPQPDMLVAADARSVAVRGKDGLFQIMRTANNTFQTREWLAGDADSRDTADPSLRSAVSCDDAGCVTEAREGGLVALARAPASLVDDCERARVVVTAYPAPQNCGAFVVGLDRLRATGAAALRLSGSSVEWMSARPPGIQRPWMPVEIEAPATPSPGRARLPDRPEATPAAGDLDGEP